MNLHLTGQRRGVIAGRAHCRHRRNASGRGLLASYLGGNAESSKRLRLGALGVRVGVTNFAAITDALQKRRRASGRSITMVHAAAIGSGKTGSPFTN